MGIFNISSWFSKKETELEKELKSSKEYITNLENIILDKKYEKPYKNLIYSNTNLTFIGNTGLVLTKSDCSKELFEQIKNSNTEEEIIALMTFVEPLKKEKNKEVIKENKIIEDNLDLFEENNDFEVKDNKVFMKGINMELPNIVKMSFLQLLEQKEECSPLDEDAWFKLDEKYQSLKFFWLKLSANPIQESREHLLEFVENNDIQLTNSGNMVLYRRIVSTGKKDKQYIHFITESYLKIKQQKQSPKNYNIGKDENGELSLYHNKSSKNWETIGNLYDLYQSLGEEVENTFTDNHTKSYKISIGEVYRIREEDVNLDKNGSCGGLLHACNPDRFDYSSFGNTDVIVLVNPMNAARIDTGCSGKIGVSEMFIVGLATPYFKEQDIINFDEEYDNITIENLENELRNKQLTLFSVGDQVTDLSYGDLSNIVNLLKQRVVSI